MHRALFVLAFVAACLAPLTAARAEDPFAVRGIAVDATAASSTEAANIAINGGRRRAWSTLLHRLVPQQDETGIPAIDDAQLQRMISGYQVENERRSTTRYMADVTYTFNGELVRRFLRGANVAYADNAAKPVLVIPLAPGYVPGSNWTAAWTGAGEAAGIPIALPTGDALDMSTLRPIEFESATWSDVQPVAWRVHAVQAMLVLAKPPASGAMTVRIRILSAGPPQALPDLRVPIPPGTQSPKGYADAALAAAGAIGDAWKARNAVDFNQRANLTALVHLDSLAQWGAIQQRLATVSVVMNINVAAMGIGQAEIQISYAGTTAQLNDFLSQAALSLTERDGKWWLASQSAADGVVTQ